MSKLRELKCTDENGFDKTEYGFKCPGCNVFHYVPVKSLEKPVWDFNWNLERPSFNPSLLLKLNGFTCHLFVRDGKIEFLKDCTHDYAGMVVPLPDLD